MRYFINKKNAAKYLRVSLPTLNKFLKENKQMIMNKKIDFESLKRWILKNAKKKTKIY